MSRIRNVILFVVIALAWVVFSRYSNPLFLPKPSSVWSSLLSLWENNMLIEGVKSSFLRITIATLLSSAISIPLGLFVSNFKVADEIITPLTRAIRFIPVTVFYPLLIMWLGIDEEMKVGFLFVATFFYFLPTVILSLREVDANLIETAYTIGMNKIQVMFKVMLQSALPSICQSFVMMYGIGWTYIVVVEVTNAKYGLGHLINIGSARGRTDMVFAAVFVIVLLNWAIDTLGNVLIKKVFSWKFAKEILD